MSTFNLLVVSFFIFAFAGQIWEIFLNRLQFGRWRYSGFLRLPIVPLYGFSALLMLSIAHFLPHNPLLIFLFSIVAISALEYLTSWLLEKLFHRRWWDYRSATSIKIIQKYQLNGRISLPVTLVWGILALLVVYVIQPHVAIFANWLFARTGFFLGAILLTIFAIDFIISLILTFRARRHNLKIWPLDSAKNAAPFIKHNHPLRPKSRERTKHNPAVVRKLAKNLKISLRENPGGNKT